MGDQTRGLTQRAARVSVDSLPHLLCEQCQRGGTGASSLVGRLEIRRVPIEQSLNKEMLGIDRTRFRESTTKILSS